MEKVLKKNSFFKSTFIVASLTLVSRFAGLVRDVLISNVLGVTMVADAFFIALRLPNIFRRITAEGAFSAVFVPIFSKRLIAGKVNAINFSQDILYILIISVTIIACLLQILMPVIMYIMAYGFSDDLLKFNLSIIYSRITAPYILFISISSLGIGILNSLGKYSIGSLLPIILNFFLIAALLLPSEDIFMTGYWLSFAVTISGFFQFIIIFYTLNRLGYSLRLKKPKHYSKINEFYDRAKPQIGTGLVLQFNILVSGVIASFAQGGISTLYYAERLYQLPLALFGISIGTVLLPTLSSLNIKDDLEEMILVIKKSVKFALIMSFPAAIGLSIISVPLIAVIYQHGLFNELNTIAVSKTLIAFSLGLPAFVLMKIYLPIFYSLGDTKNPFLYSLIAIAINVILALFLFPQYGVVGLALSTSISSWINLFLLIAKSRDSMILFFSKKFNFDILKIFISSVIMGITLYFLSNHSNNMNGILLVFTLICVGVMIYFLILFLLGVLSKNDIRSIVSSLIS